MSLLNYFPHAPLNLTCLRTYARFLPYSPPYLTCFRPLRVFVPYPPSRLTCLTYAPNLRALCSFFVRLARFIYAPIYLIYAP